MDIYTNWPVVLYENKKVADLFKRLEISDKIRTEEDLFITYIMDDGDHPQAVANRIYDNDPSYAWLLYLANNVVDPNKTFSLNTNELDNVIDLKYSGVAVFILEKSGVEINVDDYLQFYNNGHHIGDGVVWEWNAQLRKIVVMPRKPNSPWANQRNLFNPRNITIENVSIGYEEYHVGRIVYENKYAVHHFVGDVIGDNDEIIEENIILDPYNLIDSYIDGSNESVVTNEMYEYEQNERKREARIIRPEIIEEINKELDVFRRKYGKNRT